MPEHLLEIAREHFRSGRAPQAVGLCEQVLQSHPEYPAALHLLGCIAYQKNQLGIATQLLARAVRRDGSIAEYYHDLGRVHEADGRPEAAIAS